MTRYMTPPASNCSRSVRGMCVMFDKRRCTVSARKTPRTNSATIVAITTPIPPRLEINSNPNTMLIANVTTDILRSRFGLSSPDSVLE